MIKAKVIIVAGFLVSFGAGLVTGWSSHPSGGPPHRPRPWIAGELGLSVEQERQMEKIWSNVVRPPGPEDEERRRAIRRERDEAIAALIPAQQKAAYDKISKDYFDRMTQLVQDRGKLIQAAVEQTKKILTEEQWKKFDEFQKRRGAEGHGRGPGPRPEDKATSRPAPH
jgi:Spy/CpxP family protein refolding chaperone